MDRIIVYLDDASWAQQQLAPVRTGPTHWVLVACAPRMSQRIGKWVSHSSREKWRTQWAGKLLAGIEPVLRARGDQVTVMLAGEPLPPLTQRLLAEHGSCRVIDARRPKSGHQTPGDTPEPAQDTAAPRQGPGTLAGFGAALLLAAE